jgi:hypothetical protein
MYTLRSGLIAAATAALAVGCTGNVGAPSTDDPNGSGATGSGATGSGGTGTGGSSVGGSSVGGTGTGGSMATGGSATGGTSTGGTSAGGTGGSSLPPVCTPGVATTSQIPRLTNAQYDRTIRDLLGVSNLTASANNPPSAVLATDQSGGLSDLGWSAYTSVADMIAKQVMADPALKGKFLKCTPVAGDAACLHSTIIDFGRRAFRRPLTEAEIARFDAVVAKGAMITPTGAPEEVAEALLYMFLISPSFLQRAEIAETADGAGHFTLTPHETAARLSYMLWGSTPDAALDTAADTGMLTTPEQVLGQAQRMLQDPKARDMVNAFHQYYLLMGAGTRWSTAKKDPAMFPSFTTDMVGTMTEETLRIFDKLAFTPGSTFKDYLTTNIAFVTNATAPLYGLNAAQFTATLTETTVDAAQRPGFLTRLGFLNNFAGYTRTSPIFRGAFITKQILGIHIDSPPPGAEQTMLPTGPDLNTNRKQVEAMTTGPDCSGCHQAYINPPGFVMEAFNAIGSWQTTEAGTGQPIDTVADVTISDDVAPVRITNPAELMNAIANAPGAMKQYARKWVSFAYERENDPLDVCTVDQLAAKMTPGGYTVLNLVADLTQTQSFRVRAVEVSP